MTEVAAGGVLGVVATALGRGEGVEPILVPPFGPDVNNGHPFLLIEPPTKRQNMVLVKEMVLRRLWAGDLAAMVQVSFVGYASSGAFLGLAYFDFYYTLVAVILLCKTVLVSQNSKQQAQPAGDAAKPGMVERGVLTASCRLKSARCVLKRQSRKSYHVSGHTCAK